MAKSDANGPIGVFDSGLGGLSVVRAIRHCLHDEAILYVADSVHCPYGDRPEEIIRRLSCAISEYLLDQGCKLILVACNTASAAALSYLRWTFPDVEFVGMVPAVKVATTLTRSGVVGVLATTDTLHGTLYQDVVHDHANGIQVIAHASPSLVDLVESGTLSGPVAQEHLASATRGMLAAGADVIVLGCTHFPFLSEALQDVVGPTVKLVEPSEAIARRIGFLLKRAGTERALPPNVPLRCAVTGDAERFCHMLTRLLGIHAPVEQLVWRGEQVGPV